MPVVKRFANLNERARDYWVAEGVQDKFEDHFEIESELAAGPFGTLLKCRPRGQQRFCCVKVIPKQKSRRVPSKEMSHLMKLNHPNVGRLIDIFETADTLYMVSELLSGGEVLDRVSRLKNFTERDAAKILCQCLEGLRYIHDEGLVHCNLKPENFIFENDDEVSNVKIADAGVHALLDRELLKHAVLSTPHYCAPEILRNDVGHPSADMWSFGVFAYLLLVGEEPFKADNDEQLYKTIIKGQYDKSSENYQRLSVNAKDFLMKFLVVDPHKRLTAHQALMSNQWLQGKATNLENMSQTVETMREAIIRKKTLAFLQKQALRARTDKPSLTQKYLPKDVWLWLQKTTKYGTSLIDCVKSAAENPDSVVGLYAPDPDCYDTFQEIFWPVIADYHKVDVFVLKSVHDFGNPKELPEFEAKYAEQILSFRIRVGRTLKGFPMGPKLSRETRQQIQEEMVEAFRNFNGDLYGDYIELNELSYKERDALIQSHYLFNNADNKYLRSAGGYADWPLNRGIFINRAKSFVVWLNEEDHVRVISMEKGADVRRGYARLIKSLEVIEQSGVQFVYHEKFGYLTFCPTNIGTGLKVSVHVRVPKLAESGRLRDVCDSLGLQISDESEDGGVFGVSNKVSIGQSEFELVNSMCLGIKKLLDAEFAL